MTEELSDLFPLILVSALAAALVGPLMARLGRVLGLVDLPRSAPHKLHQHPTPLVGGLTIGLALAVTYLMIRPPLEEGVGPALAAGGVMLVWGLVDDWRGMAPWQKLVGQIAVGAFLIASGVQVRITRLDWLDLGLSMLWYVGMMNAFNFVDSMDGLAVGLASIASAFFMLVMVDSGQPGLALLAAAILGATVGSYVLNASPAEIFLGDSGAQLLGLLLAVLGIAYVPGGAGLPQGVSWFTPILVLGIPIFDMCLVVISRTRRRSRLYQAGTDHTYHRLVGLGLDPTRSVLLMHLTAIVLGLTAFIALDATVLVANLMFGGIVLMGLAAVAVLERVHPRPAEAP
jgi:UDP-GlcNAc:undecaprenyl-phosphate GlcNAc-1-phosphate transferase